MNMFSSVMRMASVAMGGSDVAPFPYSQGSELIAAHPSPHWRLHSGTHNSTSEPCTIFSFDKSKHDTASLTLAKNAIQKLKILRHPCILRYVDSTETATHLLLATEACTPFVHDYVRGERKKEQGMCVGLYAVVKAVSWLNNDCKLVHGAVTPASIYLLKSGEYRLFGLDIAYKHADTTASFNVNLLTPQQRSAFLPSYYRTPEHSKASSPAYFTTIEQDPAQPVPVHYIDSWCLGVLIFDLHSNGTLSSPSQLANKDIIHPQLQTEYKRLLSTNPVGRINPSVVLASSYFTSSDLVRSIHFLSELAIQSNSEKDTFFTSFAKQVSDFPDNVNKYRILPQLIDALSYGSGMSCFPSILSSVLKIGSTLTPAEFQSIIIPAVTRLFASNERMVRVHLLSNIDQYAAHLSSELINDTIFRHVITGFHDSQPILREVTMKSMPHFMAKLSTEHLQQALVLLSKMQQDPEPAIRTNTTYCIAKGAITLNAATREKVLAPAFARALKDPFGPARVAGCVAFAATIDFHTAVSCGRKIIPVVAPLCVDELSEVREAALKAMQAMMSKVQLYHQDGGVERVSALVAEVDKGGSGVDAAAASASALLANVSSWAVSSFAAKFMGGGDIGSGGAATPSPATPIKPLTTSTSSSALASPRAAEAASPTAASAASAMGSVEINRDGWDNDFTMDDFDAPTDEQDTATVVSLSTAATKKKPAAAAAPRHTPSKKKEEKKTVVLDDDDDDDDGFNDSSSNEAGAHSLDNWDSFQTALSTAPSKPTGGSVDMSAFDPFSSLSASASPSSASPSSSASAASRKKPPLIAGPPGGSIGGMGGASGVAGKKAVGAKPMSVKGKKDDDDWASLLN